MSVCEGLFCRFETEQPLFHFTILFLSFVVSADKFRYTCMGGEITIEGVDDQKDMEETRRTFSLLGKKTLQLSDCNLLLVFTLSLPFSLCCSRVK